MTEVMAEKIKKAQALSAIIAKRTATFTGLRRAESGAETILPDAEDEGISLLRKAGGLL